MRAKCAGTSSNWPYKPDYPASLGLIPCLTPVKELEYRAKNSPYHVGAPRFWLVAIM